jgi:hypothetical protein
LWSEESSDHVNRTGAAIRGGARSRSSIDIK